MSKYIDADKISSELQEMIDDLPSSFSLLDRETLMEMERGIQMARQFILNCAETADVKEVKHGKWIKDTTQIRGDGEIYDYCCSVCENPALPGPYNNNDNLTCFCPRCGADMNSED